MPEGTVKFFNRAKGFGFIVPDDGDKEIFLPPAAVTGVALSPGQRVSFELVADPKGPKAASLKVLEGAVPKPPPPMAPRPQHTNPVPPPVAVALYCNPSTQAAQDVIAALAALNQNPQVIDMAVTPPTAQQLRKWSPLLAEMGQGLVRRTMPLFFDLQLDDRFLHEDEFWTAVVLHPALLNGPILVLRERVRICKTEADVKAFFANTPVSSDTAPKAKNISSRLMAMMRGEAVGPRPQPEPEEADIEEDDGDDIEEIEEAEEVEVEAAPAPSIGKTAATPKPVKKAVSKVVPKVVPKVVKAKPMAKAAKPVAKKPVKAVKKTK